MIGPLTNHLWQSTVFALAAALLTVFFRKSRAEVRYWLWFSASIKFFVPFALLIALGRELEWPSAVREAASPAVSVAMVQISEPFAAYAVSDQPAQPTSAPMLDRLIRVLPALWLFGFMAIALIRLRVWRRIRAAVRASIPLELPGIEIPPGIRIRSTPGLLEPGVVGWWRPTLLLPSGLDCVLTDSQLKAVIAHEVTHVRRRDNVTAAIHMMGEALFWFHPLVWWIGARLVDERERACDEEVLRLFGEPEAYAEGILLVCKRYVEAPLACVSGVSGSNIKKRIEAIMDNRIGIRLSFAGKAALSLAALFALTMPIAVGSMKAQSAPAAAPSTEPTKPFEEASIRPCSPESLPPPVSGQRGGGANSFRMTPGRAYVQCMTLATLIRTAYGYGPAALDIMNTREDNGQVGRPAAQYAGTGPDMRFENSYGLGVEDGIRVRGGPDWVRSDKYTIEAIADGAATAQTMSGPMLRELLERRFQLKTHIDSEPVSAFALIVAPGGLKIKPMEEGGCTREPLSDEIKAKRDSRNGPVSLAEAVSLGVKPTCGTTYGDTNGPNFRWEHIGQSNVGGVALAVGSALEVRTIDRTAVKGMFTFAWEFSPDENTPGALRDLTRRPPALPHRPGWDAPDTHPKAASLFAVLEQQLGLKVEPIRVPREFIVIDRVARPSAN